jgi:hypothetical protein
MLPLMLLLAAAPPTDLTQLYREHAAAGRWREAAAEARKLETAAAQKAPLEIPDIQLLAAPPEGLGMYTPLADGVARGKEVYLYAQVRNHGMREALGFFELHLVSELVFFDAEGTEVARDKSFGESRYAARVPQRDTFVVIALSPKGLPSGAYRIQLVLHDEIGKKEGTGEVRLKVP